MPTDAARDCDSVEAPPDRAEGGRPRTVGTAVAPLLVGGREAARLIGLSAASFYRLRSAGGFGPAPVRLGGRVLFRVAEIADWTSQNCPDARTWRALHGRK
jgi:predicted DNA-binding transcriptional regulator AlpA